MHYLSVGNASGPPATTISQVANLAIGHLAICKITQMADALRALILYNDDRGISGPPERGAPRAQATHREEKGA